MKMGSQKGTALLMVTVVLILVMGVAGAYLGLMSYNYSAIAKDQVSEEAFVIAESGLDAAINELNSMRDYDGDGLGVVQGALGRGRYSVTIEPSYSGPKRYVLRAVGSSGEASRGIVAVIDGREGSADRFGGAVFGDLYVEIGSFSIIDSYARGGESGLGGGHVRSNGNVRVSPGVLIRGDVTAGPAGEARIPKTAQVTGETGRAPAAQAMPPVEAPSIPVTGNYLVGFGQFARLEAGDYHFSVFRVEMGATMRIQGPAILVVDQWDARSGAKIQVDGSGGPVAIYATGEFRMHPLAKWDNLAQDPSHLALRIATDNITNSSLTVDPVGKGTFRGTIYAPSALIRLVKDAEYYGSVAARAVTLQPGAKVHYDEALKSQPVGATFRVVSSDQFPVRR